MAPASMDSTAVVTDAQGARHDIDAVHAAGAFLVVDLKGLAFHPHAFGGAKVDDFFLDVEGTPVAAGVGAAVGRKFAADIGLNRFLVDFDIVSPGADEGQVGPGDGGHAAVGAAVELEFEFVGEGRTMEFILVFLGQGVAQGLGVVAGIFAAGWPMQSAGVRRLEPEPPRSWFILVGQFIENFFQLGRGGSQEDDVAGGTVHVGDAAAAEIPQITKVAQVFGGVEFATRLVDAHGVKMGHTGEILGLVAVPADDAAAVTEDADDAAVLPVGGAVFVREFQNTQKVFHHILGNLKFDTFLRFWRELRPAASSRTQSSATARIQAGPTKGLRVLPSSYLQLK